MKNASPGLKPDFFDNFNRKPRPMDAKPEAEAVPMMLVNELSKLFHDEIRASVEKLGVKGGYRQMLFHLAFCDGCQQLDLVKKTHLKAPTVSVTMQNMEADGFIERRKDEYDLRSERVFLTEKGKEYHRIVKKAIKNFESKVFDGFSEEETEMLRQYLIRMRRNLLGDVMPEEDKK